MKKFNDRDFLLMNEKGKTLYHEVASKLPVIDPHNHIDPATLANDRPFIDLYEIWVQNDPYKHRAMRICGVPENLITGSANRYDKFMAWVRSFLKTIGNPLFHWSCMELKQVFQIEEILTEDNALNIWNSANAMLATPEYSPVNILKRFSVEMLCSSDDLTDSLEHHAILKEKGELNCLPSLRSDSILACHTEGFGTWLKKLGKEIYDLQGYKTALQKKLDFFDAAGCVLSDHSLDSGFDFKHTETLEAEKLFISCLSNSLPDPTDIVKLQSHLLEFLGREYQQRQWKMQLHIGAHRYTSSRLRASAGPAGGFACIGDDISIKAVSELLDSLDKTGQLPKTILYTLNPAFNAAFASLTGSFSEDETAGKIQFGPAWWYNDHQDGITEQITALRNYGLLSQSIGMTTDSRSILSMVRHDYYRRILCNLIGSWTEEGKIPDFQDSLQQLVADISYNNIKNWIRK